MLKILNFVAWLFMHELSIIGNVLPVGKWALHCRFVLMGDAIAWRTKTFEVVCTKICPKFEAANALFGLVCGVSFCSMAQTVFGSV